MTYQQMTMKEVIVAIASVPADTAVIFDNGSHFKYPHSYRGYHEQLAISGSLDEEVNADEALVRMASIIGEELGESQYVMTEDTPVWHSSYGEVDNLAVVGYRMNSLGQLVFKTRYIDW